MMTEEEKDKGKRDQTSDHDGLKSLRFDQVYWLTSSYPSIRRTLNSPHRHDDPGRDSMELMIWDEGSNDIGVTRLTHHLESRKVGMMKFMTMLNLRANLESDYGKRLIKVSKAIHSEQELGEFRAALEVMREELTMTGKNHLDLSYQLREGIGLKLKLFIEERDSIFKKQMSNMDEVTKLRDRKVEKLKKIFDKYRQERVKFHHHRQQLDIQNDNDNEDHQVRGQVRVGSDRLRELEGEYRKLSGEVEGSWREWNESWRVTCQIFQNLEERRLKCFKGACLKYCKLVGNRITMDNESCDIILTKFKNVNVESEIQNLIQITTTAIDLEGEGNLNITIPRLHDHHFESPHPPRRPYHLFKRAISWSQSKIRTSFILDQPRLLDGAKEMSSTPPRPKSNLNSTTTSTMDFKVATIRSTSKLQPPSLLRNPSLSSKRRSSPYPYHPTARLTPPKFFVRATHPYTPTAPHELPLHLDQIVAVLQTNPDGWWVGTTLHPTHSLTEPKLFPANFTVRLPVPPSPAPAAPTTVINITPLPTTTPIINVTPLHP